MTKKKIIQTAIKHLKTVQKEQRNNPDREVVHQESDEIICEALVVLGCLDIVLEYRKIKKWYA